MNFDWQTEQEKEDVWEPEQEPATAASRSSRRRWLAALAVVALLLLAALLVRREAVERVDEATAMVEEEVVSSHALVFQAARSGDEELLVTLLSGREQSWTETQKALLAAGLLYDRAARPFGLEPAGEPEVVGVTFSPDLRAAELEMTQRYADETADGRDSVTLQQTLVYREGQQRWLLAPPEAEFWGEWDSLTAGSLTVDFPVRDEEVARRLAGDLTAVLEEMCVTLEELRCAPGWWMRLRLEKDPESLLALGEAEAGAPAGTEVSLPAPSLVGLPVDEAAYEALFRGYARHLVAAAIGDLVGWECCGNGTLFYQGLLHEQLAQLGLRPQPVTPADYLYLVDESMAGRGIFEAVRSHWNESTPAAPGESVPTAVFAFLEFLRQEEIDRSAVEMQRSLGDVSLLVRWVEEAAFREQMEPRFQRFVQERIAQAAEEAALPAGLEPPQQDLLLACGGGGEGFDLYRYVLETGSWSLEAELDAGYVQMVGGDPNGTVAVLAYEEGADGIAVQNLLWRPGDGRQGETIRLAGPEMAGVDQVWLPLAYGPSGDLAVFLYTLPVEESEPSAGLVDIETCRAGGCDMEPLPGLPIWSPSGAHLLALDVFQFQDEITVRLRAAGEAIWHEVGRAWAPVWLDDETYAYVPYAGDVRLGSLYAASIADREPQQLVAAQELMAALPARLAGRQPAISGVLPHPMDENQLLMAVRNQPQDDFLLFIVERTATDTPWLEASLTVTFVAHIEGTTNVDWISGWSGVQGIVSPNGRWLVLPLSAPGASNGGVLLYDLQNREIALRSRAGTTSSGFLGQTYDWSPNGEWFVRSVAGIIDLIAPGYEVDGRPYRQLIVHDFEACAQALWVEGD